VPGFLILCSTPIGNLGDVSPRLVEALGRADVVFAEDTRRARILLTEVGANPPVRSYFVGNEAERSTELAERLQAGATVALITDAGTPGVADPGVSAVSVARTVGAGVTVIPGPSAVTAALAVSGFPADAFVFVGFPPRKERSRFFTRLSGERRTIVLFTSPHRVHSDLADLAAHLGGDRPVCVTRELTKKFEEIWWGTLAEAGEVWGEREPKGEFTLVIGGAPRVAGDLVEAVRRAAESITLGMSRSEAARSAAAEFGLTKREIYDRLS
jgi:16S rRNA (cytidine1402-2'-O)-methyltransferase